MYFNGAKAWKKETDNLVNTSDKVIFDLVENDNEVSIKTNLYDLIGDYFEGIITTKTLGEAFEPEQRYETPEGDDIIFNEDYFGNHRGVSTIPGPFASGKTASKILWQK